MYLLRSLYMTMARWSLLSMAARSWSISLLPADMVVLPDGASGACSCTTSEGLCPPSLDEEASPGTRAGTAAVDVMESD